MSPEASTGVELCICPVSCWDSFPATVQEKQSHVEDSRLAEHSEHRLEFEAAMWLHFEEQGPREKETTEKKNPQIP